MNTGELADSLRSRVPWDVAQKLLKENDIARGRGWDQTIEKLATKKLSKKSTLALEHALREHNTYGEKSVRLYEVSTKQRHSLVKNISELDGGKNKFSRKYPISLPNDDLESTSQNKFFVAAKTEDDDHVGVTFASVRIVEHRVPLEASDLPAALAHALSEYDEFFGIKFIQFQAMDCIHVPKSDGYVEVRVDHPKNMNAAVTAATHEKLCKKVAELAEDTSIQPINLFPLMTSLYASEEGRVVELAFGTTTASRKHETMRRQKTCLRRETYHKGGKKALGTAIEPFKLSIEWDVEVFSDVCTHPEVTFNAGARISSSTHPTLHEFWIRKCLGKDDYEHVVSKIEEQLAAL